MQGDREFVQIVDAALAEAARRSGPWLVCQPGCTECCIGPFPITQLDAVRLREGLAELESRDPQRTARVRQRVRETVARMWSEFPGDPATGVLAEDEESEDRFDSLWDEVSCPVLDPETGTCDLYAARPITCRIFGPAVRSGSEVLGVCELCYHGASDQEIAACQVEPDPGDLESPLVAQAQKITGAAGETVVAFALAAR